MLITTLFLSGIVWAQETSETLTSCLNKNYPDYVIFLSDKKIDSVFYYANTSIAPVIFKVNKYKLYPNKQLESIADILRRIQQDTIIRLSHVWVGGSASPEGPPSWNYRLGEYRSRALADFLLQETGIPESKLKVENLCEDWYSFEVALKNGAQIPNKSKVLDILAKETDNERRKKQIKALDEDILGNGLFRTCFLHSEMLALPLSVWKSNFLCLRYQKIYKLQNFACPT